MFLIKLIFYRRFCRDGNYFLRTTLIGIIYLKDIYLLVYYYLRLISI